MEWKEKVESIEISIKQLIEEKQLEDNDPRKTSRISSLDDSFISVVDDGDQHHRRILEKLLSQLESLKAEDKLQPSDSSAIPTEPPATAADSVVTKTEAVEEQDIVKELKKLKKQNFITHCLLSAMIVLTVAWQFSEVTFILKVKDRVSHPFKSVGSVFGEMLKGLKKKEQDREEEKSSIKPKLIEPSSFPDVANICSIPDGIKIFATGVDCGHRENFSQCIQLC